MNELPNALRVHLLEETLRKYVKAASRMKNDWAESSKAEQNRLWRDLHSLEDDAREVLEQVASNAETKPVELTVTENEDIKGAFDLVVLEDGGFRWALWTCGTLQGAHKELTEAERYFVSRGAKVKIIGI